MNTASNVNEVHQVPRNSLFWVLASMVAVILPHVERLSWWILCVSVICGVWRLMVYRGRWYLPGRWVKVALVVTGVLAVPVSYRKVTGLDPAIALMVLAFVLKLLEMKLKRDAYLVIFLAYFVAITLFLYSQTMVTTLYVTFTVVMITAALVGLNQSPTRWKPTVTLRTSAALVGWSLPLTLVLFVFFPRIEPLWSITLEEEKAMTGVSDTMSPGDISNLALSDALAFRVTFKDGVIPPLDQLYWRGLVLAQFDGKAWTQLSRRMMGSNALRLPGGQLPAWEARVERKGIPLRYSVILEPTSQNWLFALPAMLSDSKGTALVRDNRLFSLKTVSKKFRYDVESYFNYRFDTSLSRYWRSIYTHIPDETNPLSKELAKGIYSRSTGPENYIEQVLSYFRENAFYYTLKPPRMGDDPVDEFLTGAQRGFCEHYASAFVYLMRAVGIPARVVVGYQGGELNEIGGYLAVYQYNAHAWAEVWLEGRGWIRVDPTTAIDPGRVEADTQISTQSDALLGEGGLSRLGNTLYGWVTDIRLGMSTIVYYWDSWVVGYNPSMQMQFLRQYYKNIDMKSMGVILISCLSLVTLIIAWVLLRGQGKEVLSPIDRLYLDFCRLMAQLGSPRQTGETPLAYANRLRLLKPELSAATDGVTQLYMELNYVATEHNKSDPQLNRLKAAIRDLRWRTLTARLFKLQTGDAPAT